MAGLRAGHAHPHLTHEAERRGRQRRALWIALVLNFGFMFAEVAGGLAFNSLALLADAAHMLSDVAGIAIALIATHLLTRPASARHTYGLQRAEVLGAQANGLLLLVTAGWIIFEAVRRLGSPGEVEGVGLTIVATLGLAVNVGSAVFLHRAAGESLNMRGAYLHMLADAGGSVAAIVAGLAVLLAGADWADPAISIAIAVLVVWAAVHLLQEAAQVLLEAAPTGLDLDAVERAIAEVPGVQQVHHVHAWSLASDVPALSAHLVLSGELDLHEAQARGERVKLLLAERFDIGHATLELECHECSAPAEASVGEPVERR